MKSLLSSESGPTAPLVVAAPGPFASFVRFVVCGGGVGVLSSFAVALLAVLMPWGLANAVITVASTLLCTELHSRFTFGSGKRAGWRQHWQSAGSATAAYAVTCAAMFVLHLVQSSPGLLTEQIVYLGASGLAGIGRFVVLRVFVFATAGIATAGIATAGIATAGSFTAGIATAGAVTAGRGRTAQSAVVTSGLLKSPVRSAFCLA